MKVIRRLCLRGNACYVSVPHQLRGFLRWNIGDALVVETVDTHTVRIRRVEHEDLTSATIPPINLELPAAAAK